MAGMLFAAVMTRYKALMIVVTYLIALVVYFTYYNYSTITKVQNQQVQPATQPPPKTKPVIRVPLVCGK
jgi:Ca2+/Na+ antiporter